MYLNITPLKLNNNYLSLVTFFKIRYKLKSKIIKVLIFKFNLEKRYLKDI